jgi:16S rRNA (adenine1518-N6/adenine1519-N6)-dimethyltransferase
MVFMVQKEVSDRLTAQPGGKTYGPLAVWSQLNYEVKNIKNVSPTCFMPAPKVWSAVVRFEKRAAPLAEVPDYARFKQLIKLAFTQRRKQIGSNLRKNAPEFFQGLEPCGIDPAARPEQLSIPQWAALSRF